MAARPFRPGEPLVALRRPDDAVFGDGVVRGAVEEVGPLVDLSRPGLERLRPLAAFLNIPCVCVVTKLDIDEGGTNAEITRQIAGGSEIIDAPLPLLITCQKGLNQPKLPSLKGIIAAKKKEIEVMDAASVNFDPIAMGAEANRIQEVEFSLPPVKDKGVILEGSSEEAVAQLVKILRDDVKVI